MDSTGNGQYGFNTAATPEFMSSSNISRSGSRHMPGQMTGSVYSGESAPYFTPRTQRYARSNTMASHFSQESGNSEPVFYSPQSWEGTARSRMGSVSSSVQYNSSHGHPQRVQQNVLRPDNANYYGSPQRSFNLSGQQMYTPQSQWNMVGHSSVQHDVLRPDNSIYYGSPQRSFSMSGNQTYNPQAQWNLGGQAGAQYYGQQVPTPQTQWNAGGQAGVQHYRQQVSNQQAQWNAGGQAGGQHYGHQYLPHNALGEYNTHFQGSHLGYKQSTPGAFTTPLTDEAIAHGYIPPPPLTYAQVASSSTSTTQPPPEFFSTGQHINPINTQEFPIVRRSRTSHPNNMQNSSTMEAPYSSTARVHQARFSEATQESDMPAPQGGNQQVSSSTHLWQRPVPFKAPASSSETAVPAPTESQASNQLSEGAVDLRISAHHGGNPQLPSNMAPPRSFTSFNAQSASFRPSNAILAQSYRSNQLPVTTTELGIPAHQSGNPQILSTTVQSSPHGNPVSFMGYQPHANFSQPIQPSQFSGNGSAFDMPARQPAHIHPFSMNPSEQVSLAEPFQHSQISENVPTSSMPTNYPVNTHMSPMGPPARPINPPAPFQSSSMGQSSQSSTPQYQPSGLSQNTTHFGTQDNQAGSEAVTAAQISSNAMGDTTRFPNTYTVKDFAAHLLPEHRRICPESLAGYNNCKCEMDKLCEDFNNEQHGDECYEGEYCWLPHIKYSCESSILGNGCREAETGVKIAGRTMHERFRKHWREGERDADVWSRQASASLRWAHSIGEWPEQK